MSTGEKLIQMGLEQGIEQGLIIGARQLLLQQLELRFGTLTLAEAKIIQNCQNRDQIQVASRVFINGQDKESVLNELR